MPTTPWCPSVSSAIQGKHGSGRVLRARAHGCGGARRLGARRALLGRVSREVVLGRLAAICKTRRALSCAAVQARAQEMLRDPAVTLPCFTLIGKFASIGGMLLCCVVVVGLAAPGRWHQPTRAASRTARPVLLSVQPPVGGARRAPPAGATDARRSRFRRKDGPPIVCAPSLAAYQAALREHLLPGDTVVEVGCQLGGTTALLAESAARVFGVDMDRDLADPAVRKSNAAYRQHATPADAGLPECVSLALLDPWDGAAMGALTAGLQVDPVTLCNRGCNPMR